MSESPVNEKNHDLRCVLKFSLFVVLWSVSVIPVGSFIYALVSYFVPYVAVSLATLFSMVVLNGCGVIWWAKRTDFRSQTGIVIAALVLGVWSFYLSWVSWIWILNEFWSEGLIFDPRRLGKVIYFLATENLRTLGERPIKSYEQCIYWTLEAIVLIFEPVAVVLSERKKRSVRRTAV
ncbi:MAG: hypothetical protein LBM70_09775 [Victivallales bacterium]|nr:hypothetical protein [Victivallales bacterium]